MTFDSFALSAPIQDALRAKNYTTPTPIQEQTIAHVLSGHDVLGCAQTGTGKTAAFALPILEQLARKPKNKVRNTPRVLVLAPTRELASQIKASFDAYGANLPFTSEVIFGGVSQYRQEKGMQRGPEIVVATPGRLLDLLQSRHVLLHELEIFVLDEADRMLDMGFIHDVRRIIALLPKRRQTLFFSATMPGAIQQLSSELLVDPKKVMVTPESTTVEKIEQTVCHLMATHKKDLLRQILQDQNEGLTLVFSGTKHGANRIAEGLTRSGIPAEAIHGNKSQNARERALENFRTGRSRVLVATDIAARGIDVKGVALVVNYDLPKEPECYVHRIGRTARAGAEGRAISLVGEHDVPLLKQIERKIRMSIPVDEAHDFVRKPGASAEGRSSTASEERRQPRPQQQRNQPQRRNDRPAANAGESDRGRPQHAAERPRRDDRPQRQNDRPAGNYGENDRSRSQPSAERPRRDDRSQRHDQFRGNRRNKPGAPQRNGNQFGAEQQPASANRGAAATADQPVSFAKAASRRLRSWFGGRR